MRELMGTPTRPLPRLPALLRGLVFLAQMRASERRFRRHARARQHHQIATARHLEGMAAELQLRVRLCDQRMRIRGVCSEMVDRRMDGDSEGQIDLTAEDDGAQSTLDLFAGQALGLWDLLGDLDLANAAKLRPKLRILLEEMGRIIASEMVMDPAEPGSEGGNLH